MKANELRIGNWVKSKCHNGLMTEIFSISSIRTVRLGLNPTVNYEIKEVSPIPLTEEILLKCGFEKKNGGWHIMNLINVWTFIFYHPIHGVAELSINKHGAILSDQCKYLHQLQNLYFALTGEELEVKL